MLRHRAGWTTRGSGEFTSSDDDSDADTPEASTPRSSTPTPKSETLTPSVAATDGVVTPEGSANQEAGSPLATGNEAGQYATDSVHSFGAYLCYAYIELCKELDKSGRHDIAAQMRQQLCTLLGGYHSTTTRPAEQVDLLTFEEPCDSRKSVASQSNFHNEASLHAIAQSTIRQLKAKADGHEDENKRLTERLRKYEETFVMQSNQLVASEKHLERVEKDFNDTLAQLRFCKFSVERERQGRISDEARGTRLEAENAALKAKLAHTEAIYGHILQQFEAAKRENRDEIARDSNDTSTTASEDSGLRKSDTSETARREEDDESSLTIVEDNHAEVKNGQEQTDSTALPSTAIPTVVSVLPSVRGNAIIKLDIPNFRPFARSGGLSTSAYTHICGVPWRVLATCQPQSGVLQMGVFVQALYREHDQRHNVVASLRLVSQKGTVSHVTRRISATFCNARKDWGYVSFARVEDVINPTYGFMLKGIVKLTADVYAEEVA